MPYRYYTEFTYYYLYPKIPPYSVYNISRIGLSKRKLDAFIDAGVLSIADIPAENDLSVIQSNRVYFHNNNTEIFKKDEIKTEIEKIEYSIYFLDYETLPTAIPLYDSCYPFQ